MVIKSVTIKFDECELKKIESIANAQNRSRHGTIKSLINVGQESHELQDRMKRLIVLYKKMKMNVRSLESQNLYLKKQCNEISSEYEEKLRKNILNINEILKKKYAIEQKSKKKLFYFLIFFIVMLLIPIFIHIVKHGLTF